LAATTFLDESQLLIFGGRQGRNDDVNSCTLQQTNVIWKPILPSLDAVLSQGELLPQFLSSKDSQEIVPQTCRAAIAATADSASHSIAKRRAAMDCHERDEMLLLCCPAFHHLYAAAFRRAVS
jgi:hypothetical protein